MNGYVVMDNYGENATEYVTRFIENGSSDNYEMIGFIVITGLLMLILVFLAKNLKNLLKLIGYVYIVISTIGACVLMNTEKGFLLGFAVFIQGTLLGGIAVGMSKLLNNMEDERLKYIEELVIYTKNQIKDINEKVDKISGNYEEE
ncbi:MAG: hypothetical protein Q4D26_09170 [Clostridia bacterium]|nr:hypothetical protein [Clostridia bacterium]